MAAKNPKEVFVHLLSGVRQGTERTTKIFQEISQLAQDPDVKEALEARVFISDQLLARLDQCFKLIGEQPLKLSGRLHDVFVEAFASARVIKGTYQACAFRWLLLYPVERVADLDAGNLEPD